LIDEDAEPDDIKEVHEEEVTFVKRWIEEWRKERIV
jgi:hypothetical protein